MSCRCVLSCVGALWWWWEDGRVWQILVEACSAAVHTASLCSSLGARLSAAALTVTVVCGLSRSTHSTTHDRLHK